ncbi:hypothetical protein JJD61_07365 [Pseudomonas carnis]|uniref:hypothetical protein n=1 Tax=Pseudomonas carnis TaxID=2487355 RepID=UPI00190AF7B5|nr:hypothetical protein [Pseudomonas carnis]MBK3470500.1 hypothetical protein [Pseudomonas carnis]
MTTNQTIDGVPRAWLEEYESLADLTSGDAQRLRALLDAPAKLPVIDAHNERLIASLRNRVTELEAAPPQGEPVAYLDIGAGGYVDLGTDQPIEALEKLPYGRHTLGIIGTYGADGWKSSVKPPASEDESRPVAYAVFADNGNIRLWSRSLGVVEMISGSGLNPVPLYAEQPAPVAASLYDPGPDQQVEARAKEIYEGWSYNPGFATWVDGGNSIMQSKARDLARRELAPVAAAQTCCGSCPGGCVYGLKA